MKKNLPLGGFLIATYTEITVVRGQIKTVGLFLTPLFLGIIFCISLVGVLLLSQALAVIVLLIC